MKLNGVGGEIIVDFLLADSGNKKKKNIQNKKKNFFYGG